MKTRALAALFAIVATVSGASAFYEVGDEVQDFTLLTPTGEAVSLSDFAGDVILINFFATW